MVDDRAHLGDGQGLTDILERGNILRDPSLALLAVTGSTCEINEQVPAHRHVRVARIAAAVAATTASSKRSSRNAGCGNKGDRQGDAAHVASIFLQPGLVNRTRARSAWLRTPRSRRPSI